jgi:hypothetical protein
MIAFSGSLRRDTISATLHMFGATNARAVQRVLEAEDLSARAIRRVAARDGADPAAVLAHLGWLPDADTGADLQMWEPGEAIAVLDGEHIPVLLGWALCKMLVVPLLGWPPQWRRRIVKRNMPENDRADRMFAAMRVGWREPMPAGRQ